MGWQPINTAPADTPVIIGGYQMTNDGLVWREGAEIVARSYFFGLYRKRTNWLPTWASHFKQMPQPPEGTE